MRLSVLLFVVVLAATAQAHHADVRTAQPLLDPLEPRLAGVTVQLQHTLADQLVVENRTGRVLEVLDDAGTPFLRLGPDGAEANVAADAWYRSSTPDDVGRAAPLSSVEPRWVRVADDPAWGWFDRRLRVEPTSARWSVPVRFDGDTAALGGAFRRLSAPVGSTTSRVTSPAEPWPGVRVSLVGGGAPALWVENASGCPVVIAGTDGEAFLRIAPDGTSANLRSPTWLASGRASVGDVPASVGGEPVWSRVSTSSRYGWIEARAATTGDGPPVGTVDTTIVRRWSVPIEHDGERATIAGVVEWRP